MHLTGLKLAEAEKEWPQKSYDLVRELFTSLQNDNSFNSNILVTAKVLFHVKNVMFAENLQIIKTINNYERPVSTVQIDEHLEEFARVDHSNTRFLMTAAQAEGKLKFYRSAALQDLDFSDTSGLQV